MSKANATISVSNLTKYYGDFCALDQLSFEVERGEIIGFLGPNGAGKSTAMKILTCFMSANSGLAKVAGFDVYAQAEKVKQRVGYLPENNPLYSDMVVYDYLRYIAEVRRLPRARHEERIAAVAKVCGISHVMHRLIRELSKGYRQRVGLAQAMIHEPEVLILDEPTSGLDPNQIIEIRDLIKEIGKQKTVVLSTHILQEVEAVCDRILLIDRGRLIASGTVAQLAQRLSRAPQFVLKLGGQTAQEQARKALSGLPGVSAVECVGADFVITLERSDGFAEALNRLVAAQKWVILELIEKKADLETIFRTLTGGSVSSSAAKPSAIASDEATHADDDDKDADDDDEDDKDDDKDEDDKDEDADDEDDEDADDEDAEDADADAEDADDADDDADDADDDDDDADADAEDADDEDAEASREPKEDVEPAAPRVKVSPASGSKGKVTVQSIGERTTKGRGKRSRGGRSKS
ncbi:MAG: ATP-binding cassette domain-containing protein [Myxococcota bacterium]|jgi:ABC-2 type transport system ATP-binding protein|nr:ATP-binding cassette domain-containing protein [Myxococcota bacterium]